MKTSILDLVARKIVWKIVEDLSDRRGLRQEWEQIDKETQKEIKETWEKIIKQEFEEKKEKKEVKPPIADKDKCKICGGAGWLWWHELKPENYSGPANDPHDCQSDDTRYTCDRCNGTGIRNVNEED